MVVSDYRFSEGGDERDGGGGRCQLFRATHEQGAKSWRNRGQVAILTPEGGACDARRVRTSSGAARAKRAKAFLPVLPVSPCFFLCFLVPS